jgi:hypothetical protein
MKRVHSSECYENKKLQVRFVSNFGYDFIDIPLWMTLSPMEADPVKLVTLSETVTLRFEQIMCYLSSDSVSYSMFNLRMSSKFVEIAHLFVEFAEALYSIVVESLV